MIPSVTECECVKHKIFARWCARDFLNVHGGDMSGESSYLDDVIIRGRSRASDVPDVHPRPEQRLQKGVLSVSPVDRDTDFRPTSSLARSELAPIWRPATGALFC